MRSGNQFHLLLMFYLLRNVFFGFDIILSFVVETVDHVYLGEKGFEFLL